MSAGTQEKSLLRTVWDAFSFSEIRTAMRVVFRHMFVKPVTFEALVDILQTLEKYWFEIVELPPSMRNTGE